MKRQLPIAWFMADKWWVSVVDDAEAHKWATAEIHKAKVLNEECTWKEVPEVERSHNSRVKGFVVYKEVRE